MKSILEVIGPFNEDILDNLKYLFMKKNIIINNENNLMNEENKNDYISEENSSDEDLEKEDDIDNEKDKIKNNILLKSDNENKLSAEDYNLINGDDIILEKIEEKKKKKKVNLNNFSNILDELEIK